MRTLITSAFVFLMLAAGSQVFAQSDAQAKQLDTYISVLRSDIRSGKKQLVAANLKLTDAEAQKFWPVYDQYSRDTEAIYSDRLQIIKDYAATIDTLTAAQASALVKRMLDSDNALTQVRKRYQPMFAKVINGKSEALFYQIDRRLGILIDLQLAIQIPFVQP